MDVSVVIISYNTGDILKSCIESVLCQSGVLFEIIVVDNDSQDDSVDVLRTYGSSITTIVNATNIGFGRANNQALQYCHGRYLFLLNPDAALLTAQDLKRAMTYMDENPQYGLAGTRIVGASNKIQKPPKAEYPGERSLARPLPPMPGQIAWVLGASMVVSRAVYESVGGFDEAFFLYGEEADLCLRIRQRGYAIGYCESVAVAHIGGASERSADIESIQIKKQNGLHLFYTKHYGPEDVIRLVSRNRARAQMRLALMNIKNFFSALTEHQKNRYTVYKAIDKSSEIFLKNYSEKRGKDRD